MESAEQPTNQLHQQTQAILEREGNHESTIPPQESPVLTDQAKQWIEETTQEKIHDTIHAANVTINPDESAKDRVARVKPTGILLGKLSKLRDLRNLRSIRSISNIFKK